MEKEWLDTLSTINPEEVTYTDFVDAGTMLARELKKNKNCEIVIALTHMRTPNDIRLAENVAEIDLILGGHDHVYEKKKVGKKIQKCYHSKDISHVRKKSHSIFRHTRYDPPQAFYSRQKKLPVENVGCMNGFFVGD